VVNSPMYATGVGLVIYGSKDPFRDSRGEGNFITNTIRKIRKWFLDFF
jgi:cell division protein FtsA